VMIALILRVGIENAEPAIPSNHRERRS